MGLFDALRGRRTKEPGGETAGGEIGPMDPGEPDPIDLRPRTDGSYLSEAGALRFTGSQVRESPETDPAAARRDLGSPDARTGEYTSAGRFLVRSPARGSVTFSAVAVTPELLSLRRTDIGTGDSAVYEFRFQPD